MFIIYRYQFLPLNNKKKINNLFYFFILSVFDFKLYFIELFIYKISSLIYNIKFYRKLRIYNLTHHKFLNDYYLTLNASRETQPRSASIKWIAAWGTIVTWVEWFRSTTRKKWTFGVPTSVTSITAPILPFSHHDCGQPTAFGRTSRASVWAWAPIMSVLRATTA